ncbi:MAG: DNA recombination protein RecN [Synergistales bacterium]
MNDILRGLSEFSVQNIGGIQKARLELHSRFIAVTGESGAGKSSLVRALEYLAGKRAQVSSIRHGYDEGEVWGVFLGSEENEEGVAGRILSREAKNRNYLGEEQVAFARLRDFTGNRLGIQSQFSQLDLLEPRQQRDLLDSCGGEISSHLRNRLAEDFQKAIRLERELAALQEKRREIEKNYQDAEAVVETARRLRLDDGNEAGWAEELSSVEQFLSRQRKLQDMAVWFLGGSSGGGIGEELLRWIGEVDNLVPQERQQRLTPSLEALRKGLQEMEGFSRETLSDKSISDAEERRDLLENRLGTLRKLKRLARVESLEELIAFCERAEGNLNWMRTSGQEIDSLLQLCREARKEVLQTARALRENRLAVARRLEETVTAHLADLAMETFHFGVALNDLGKIRPSGSEEIEFTLSNGGLNGPIARVASGGELSRILLALQMSLPDRQLPGTLVFDEVEAGLGGRSALLAGFKLRELSNRCQVILVTHEAVIAAQAEQHFVVRRTGDLTTVLEVTGEDRAAEIARMLSGTPDSPEALEHAAVLLKNQA